MVLSMIQNFFRGSSNLNRSMYPVKGSCRFPNIFEQLAIGRVRSVNLEEIRFLPQVWKIGINLIEIDGEMHLEPFISYKCEVYPQSRLGYYLGIKNLDYCTSTVVLPSDGQAPGFCFKFLDLKPEHLDNGALIIEYGTRVEAIQDADKVWNFQLYTNFFDSKGEEVMIPFRENRSCQCHPQIKAIHDNSIEIEEENIDFYTPLQIAHGVRNKFCPHEIHWAAHHAHLMGLRNVIQYCQWQLIQQPLIDLDSPENEFNAALVFDMRSFLVHLIREINSKDRLMKILKMMYIDKMSGESMKTFMKFLLYD